MPYNLEIPTDGITAPTTPYELGGFLSGFRLDESLRFIGEMSFEIQREDPPVLQIDDVPVTNGVLAYIALKLISYSNNSQSKIVLDARSLKKAIQIWARILEPITNKDEADEYFLRQNLSQYYFNEDTQYHLARSYALFTKYWNDNEYSKKLDINALYQSITGFSIKEASLFGTILSINSPKGLVRYSKPEESFRNRLLRSGVDPLRQLLFFQWFGQTYSSYRGEIRSNQKENYLDKYQKNPLLKKPLAIPEHSFNGSYLVPIPILLAFAVTSGIFHLLGDKNINSQSKDFRDQFGKVFEDYAYDQVSRIRTLRNNPLREIKYGKKGAKKVTSDIAIINDTKAVLIEVKHSCLNLQSKLSGSLAEVREAIKENIVHGIAQLSRFRYNIEHSNQISIPDEFKEVTDFEHLIITHDNISGLNSIIREQAKIVVSEDNENNIETPEKVVPDNFHVHIMNISELERIVEIPDIDLFAFLRSKRGTEFDRIDFDEYAESKYGLLPHNDLLKYFFEEFMDGFRK